MLKSITLESQIGSGTVVITRTLQGAAVEPYGIACSPFVYLSAMDSDTRWTLAEQVAKAIFGLVKKSTRWSKKGDPNYGHSDIREIYGYLNQVARV